MDSRHFPHTSPSPWPPCDVQTEHDHDDENQHTVVSFDANLLTSGLPAATPVLV